eukprot:Gregarina_sp_Poly_1__6694@NODE_35_length_18769_cov_73_980644_g30_i0_p14_GENE_NODE_35_length_18769_cov_73_980644_g30_i0NODE_35_length_18769_cov_73_980644_g30_i0_p14_ORF_typecomplete_len148_score8_35PIGP/PF08510_12/2_8e24DUF3302/PF11742_8/0_0014DUF3302/PF11742_8/6_2e03DUF3302/PF11742_8/1_3e04DPM2/PF07297_12/0_005MBOAT/PF03062_19/0_026CCSMST1/PF15013_6/0_053CCSMST1/PF15013_6/6_6e03_NODE_35_length_18769_cov_73_980644_g30_i040434486
MRETATKLGSPVVTTAQETSIEVYGFVSFLLSHVVFVIYLIWALIPDDVLQNYGITHYPTKYWAVAIPAWAWVLFPNYFCSSFAVIAFSKIPEPSSPMNFQDSHSIRHPVMDSVKGALPPLSDIPLAVAQQLLHSPERLSQIVADVH